MTDKPLTKQQLASLEGVYHKGQPWEMRTGETPDGKPWFSGNRYGGGGSINRMIDRLASRGYLNRERGEPYKLTAKGYAALSESKAAMKFIDRAKLEARWQTRQREEYAAKIAAEEERRQRAERQRIAEETSRRERLAKLREVLDDPTMIIISFDEDTGCSLDFTDDELLAFAERVHEIMEAY